MDEEVLASLLRDESEALLVTEPLHGSTHICALPSRRRSDQNVLQSGPDKAEPLAQGSSGETDATTTTTVADSIRAPRSADVAVAGRASVGAGQRPRLRSWSSSRGRSTRAMPMAWSP